MLSVRRVCERAVFLAGFFVWKRGLKTLKNAFTNILIKTIYIYHSKHTLTGKDVLKYHIYSCIKQN